MKFKALMVGAVLVSGTAFAQTTAEVEVSGTVEGVIELTAADGLVSLGAISPGGTNTGSENLTVNSTSGFKIEAQADKATLTLWDDEMNDYHSSAKALQAPLEITTSSTNGNGIPVQDVPLTGSVPVYTKGDPVSNATINASFHQPVAFGEVVSGETYKMVVTFTATTDSVN